MLPPVSSQVLVRIRDRVLQDPVALEKWSIVVDHIVQSAVDQKIIRAQLKSTAVSDVADGILKSLQLWDTSGAENRVDLLDVLAARKLNTLASKIREIVCGSLIRTNGVWFEVGEVVYNFTGRETELAQLHKTLSENHSRESSFGNIVCVSGLGGVGKSMLARKYAYQQKDFYNGNVIWVNAESHQSMWNSFVRLGAQLGLSVEDTLARMRLKLNFGAETSSPNEKQEIVASVYTKLAGRKCLFIFDNVSDPDELSDFMPRIPNPADGTQNFLLVTSRRNDIAPLKKCQLKLDVLSPNEAARLLCHGSPDAKQENAILLARKLQFLPLALQQALAYIRDKYLDDQQSIAKYLAELDRFTAKANLLGDTKFQRYDKHFSPVLTTWNITMARIRNIENGVGHLAIGLMNRLSWLNPDHISQGFLDKLMKKDTEPALKVLERHSMINVRMGTVTLHRLVQQVVRFNLATEETETETRLASIVSELERYFDSELNEDILDEFGCPAPLTEEAKEITAHGVQLFSLQQEQELSIENFRYLHKLCMHLDACRNFAVGISVARQTIAAAVAENGHSYSWLALLKFKLAQLLFNSPHTKVELLEALRLTQSVVEYCRSEPEEPILTESILGFRSFESGIQRALGFYSEALSILNEVIPPSSGPPW